MEAIRAIALAVASVLTLVATVTSVYAVTDWQQNAIDTLAMILVALTVFSWLLVAMITANLSTRRQLESAVDRIAVENKKVTDASKTLNRLRVGQDTHPMPYIIGTK